MNNYVLFICAYLYSKYVHNFVNNYVLSMCVKIYDK